jgi:thymidylate kinase
MIRGIQSSSPSSMKNKNTSLAKGAPTPILLSFSGMDGSGKSTQIEQLCNDLANSGFTVKRVEFWNNVVAFSSLRADFSRKVLQSDGEVGHPDKPAQRNDKNARKWYLIAGRHVLYLFDAIKLRRVVNRLLTRETDVIVFDRYIFDQLATLPLERSFTNAYAKFILKLVPRPHISFLIDAVPEVARARKPEYPLDFMHRYRKAYLQLSTIAGLTVVPPLDIEEAHRAILREVEPQLRRPLTGNDFASVVPA